MSNNDRKCQGIKAHIGAFTSLQSQSGWPNFG